METRRDIEQADSGTAERVRYGFEGATRDRLATSLADQFAALYDVRPVDPQVQLAGDVLTFSFNGGLSTADESLLEVGRDEELRDFREHFLRVIGDQLCEVVEALGGSKVRHFFAAFEPRDRATSCFFVLGDPADDERQRR